MARMICRIFARLLGNVGQLDLVAVFVASPVHLGFDVVYISRCPLAHPRRAPGLGARGEFLVGREVVNVPKDGP